MAIACEECTAIAREIQEAFVETWLSASPELRDARVAIGKLRGGTEEDVLRVEELLPNAAAKSSPRIGIAIRRKLGHEARTSHRVPRPHESLAP
jgi:hypothetical protein